MEPLSRQESVRRSDGVPITIARAFRQQSWYGAGMLKEVKVPKPEFLQLTYDFRRERAVLEEEEARLRREEEEKRRKEREEEDAIAAAVAKLSAPPASTPDVALPTPAAAPSNNLIGSLSEEQNRVDASNLVPVMHAGTPPDRMQAGVLLPEVIQLPKIDPAQELIKSKLQPQKQQQQQQQEGTLSGKNAHASNSQSALDSEPNLLLDESKPSSLSNRGKGNSSSSLSEFDIIHTNKSPFEDVTLASLNDIDELRRLLGGPDPALPSSSSSATANASSGNSAPATKIPPPRPPPPSSMISTGNPVFSTSSTPEPYAALPFPSASLVDSRSGTRSSLFDMSPTGSTSSIDTSSTTEVENRLNPFLTQDLAPPQPQQPQQPQHIHSTSTYTPPTITSSKNSNIPARPPPPPSSVKTSPPQSRPLAPKPSSATGQQQSSPAPAQLTSSSSSKPSIPAPAVPSSSSSSSASSSSPSPKPPTKQPASAAASASRAGAVSGAASVKLTSEQQAFVSMGFAPDAVATALEKYKSNQEEVMSYLLRISDLSGLGFKTEAVLTALDIFGDDEKAMMQFLEGCNLLDQMGFEGKRVYEALLMSENDAVKAIDYLST